jgi:hypothetical protein
VNTEKLTETSQYHSQKLKIIEQYGDTLSEANRSSENVSKQTSERRQLDLFQQNVSMKTLERGSQERTSPEPERNTGSVSTPYHHKSANK